MRDASCAACTVQSRDALYGAYVRGINACVRYMQREKCVDLTHGIMVDSYVKRHYVYCTTNQINGKRYIGQHVTYLETKEEMLNDGYLGSCVLLLRAFRKYGRRSFTKEIYDIVNSARSGRA